MTARSCNKWYLLQFQIIFALNSYRLAIPGISTNSAFSSICPPLSRKSTAIKLMVIVIGRSIEAVPKSKPLVQLRQQKQWFLDFWWYPIIAHSSHQKQAPIYAFQYALLQNPSFKSHQRFISIKIRRATLFCSDANFAFQLCLFFRFILLLSLSKIIEGKNGLK